jgi:PAS domain S-box-containing protein
LGKIIRFDKRAGEAVAKQLAQATKRNVAAFAADADGNYLFVNSHWSRLAGIAQDRALGQGWLQSVHPDDREEVAQNWLTAVRGEQYFGLSYRIHSAESGTCWVTNQAIPQHDDDGALTGYSGTITDQSQLSGGHSGQSSESRLRAMLDLLDIGYYEHDLVTGEMTLSPSCSNLIAAAGARTIEECDAFVHPEDLAESIQQFDQLTEAGAMFYALEYRVMSPRDEWIRIRDYGKIFYDADGKPLHAAGLFAPAELFQGSIEDNEVAVLCRLAIKPAG